MGWSLDYLCFLSPVCQGRSHALETSEVQIIYFFFTFFFFLNGAVFEYKSVKNNLWVCANSFLCSLQRGEGVSVESCTRSVRKVHAGVRPATLCCVTGSWAARSSQLAMMLWTSLTHITCLSLQRGQGANSYKRHAKKKKNGQNVLRKAQVILTFSTCYGSSTRDICYYNWVKSIRTVKHSAFDFNRKQHPFIIWGWFIISLHNNPYQCHINTNILSYNTNRTLLVKNAGNALSYRIIILQKQFIYEIVATNSSQLSLNGIINYKSVLMTLSLTRKSSKQSQINF